MERYTKGLITGLLICSMFAVLAFAAGIFVGVTLGEAKVIALQAQLEAAQSELADSPIWEITIIPNRNRAAWRNNKKTGETELLLLPQGSDNIVNYFPLPGQKK